MMRWPRIDSMRSATMRAITSVLPPGAKPTVSVMVLLGKASWALSVAGESAIASATRLPWIDAEYQRMPDLPENTENTRRDFEVLSRSHDCWTETLAACETSNDLTGKNSNDVFCFSWSDDEGLVGLCG